MRSRAIPSGTAGPTDEVEGSAVDEAQAAFAKAKVTLDPASPITYQLNKALEEISGAARSTHELADFLERNPSAVIRGRAVSQNGR
jgi:paraquat-inducible protein B